MAKGRLNEFLEGLGKIFSSISASLFKVYAIKGYIKK
jgi:hypothetical protein